MRRDRLPRLSAGLSVNARPRPKAILVLGIVLACAGAVLQLVLPALGFSIAAASTTALGMDQDILLGVDFAVRAVGLIIAPLGSVLIGAGIVMGHVTRIVDGVRRDEAPHPGETRDTAHAADGLL